MACSGGPDSVALTHVLWLLREELGLTLTVASVDHGLRQEAVKEVEGVQGLARTLALPFVPLRVELPAGESLQAAARDARYSALRAAADGLGAPLVAVGHHQDDQAETVLFRLLRGAALESLGAIAPRREDGVIRPLFDADRATIQRHLRHHNLPSVTDPSNQDPRFLRSRIRHRLLPQLAEENPSLRQHLCQLADEVAGLKPMIEARTKEALARAASNADAPSMTRAPLLEESLGVRRSAVRCWLEDTTGCRAGTRKIDAIERLLGLGRGEVPVDSRWSVRATEHQLTLFSALDDD